MSNILTTDELRESTRRRFAPFQLTIGDGSKVLLSSALRLSADDRKVVKEAIDDVNKLQGQDDESPEAMDRLIEAVSKVFNAITDKPAKLLSDLDDPDPLIKAALMTRVLNEWAKETQLGEA